VEPINHQNPSNILLINPPAGSLASPPWAPASVAGFLSGSGLPFEQYDANLDFFLNYLLTSRRLNILMSLIREREKSGGFDKSIPYIAALLAELAANPECWKQKEINADKSLKLLRTEAFFLPESCLAAINNINDLLDFVSLAFYPSHIQLGYFSNTGVKDWSSFGRFVEDQNINPFLSFCQDRLAPKLAGQKPDLIILFVSDPNQVFAALTMANYANKERPDLHVVLMSDFILLKDAANYVDTLLPESDVKPLLDLIHRLWKTAAPVHAAEPDFNGFPLKDYLAPAIVLPFRAQISSKAGLMSPTSLFTFLKKQNQKYSAVCFHGVDEHLTPAYISEFTGEISGEEKTLDIGLTCTLHASITKEQIDAACQAGVKLIQWRDPTGQLKSLTKILWSAAESGIWNHLVLPPADKESSMTQGLYHFMKANPNIIHSSSRCRLPYPPFKSPSEQAGEALGTYSQVTRLPGEPFWENLNDPAYLLLYIVRHGIKKTIRWRLSNDGYSIYRVGQNVEFHFVKPGELPTGYLDEICRMVEAGGSVKTKWVRYNLKRAFLIGYALEQGSIVGNSSLKQPRPEYVETVKKQSDLDLSRYLERGYTSVRPEYRGLGIGTKLLEGLTSRAGHRKIFSIISEDNLATRKIAIRNRTRKVAVYYSEHMGKQAGIWMPEWMIED